MAAALVPHPSVAVLLQTYWAEENEVGTRIAMLFDHGTARVKWYPGTITAYCITDKVYKVQYEDGTKGTYTDHELLQDALAGVLKILQRAA